MLYIRELVDLEKDKEDAEILVKCAGMSLMPPQYKKEDQKGNRMKTADEIFDFWCGNGKIFTGGEYIEEPVLNKARFIKAIAELTPPVKPGKSEEGDHR